MDAATEFFGQANEFDQSLGAMVGSAVVELVKSDVSGRQANAGVIEALLVGPDGKARANVEVVDSFSFGDGKGGQGASFKVSEPIFLLTELSSFLPQTAQIDFSMNLSASANDAKSYAAQEAGSGEGSIGWGPFKVSVKISASAAEKGSSTRKSDYRSKGSCTVTMGRVPPPEGVARLNDLLTSISAISERRLSKHRHAMRSRRRPRRRDLTVVKAAPSPSGGGAGG